MTTILFQNANIFTPRDSGRPIAGPIADFHQPPMQHHGKGAILVENGLIARVGPEDEILRELTPGWQGRAVDCKGRCLVPGFVDPHTHMCFARRREAEFEQRIAGTPYLEILEKGGGILSSVRAVRQADEEALFAMTKTHVLSAASLGTTTLEIKSGYGLDTASELKMLKVIDRVGRQTPVDVVPTFLGAHAVPPEYKGRSQAYVDCIINEMLPAVQHQGIARYCDVFCETGVFSIDESRRILEAAIDQGLAVKIHADEVHDTGGAGLAADLKAVSADHLLASNNQNLTHMADQGVVAVLLPATAYSLRKPYARARFMLDGGLPVALATDCNPGSSYTESLPFVIGLGVLNMQMTPAEALVGATLNAAYAIGMSRKTGSLDVGKQADFCLLEGDTPSILAYHAGVAPVTAVYKRGILIFRKEDPSIMQADAKELMQ